MKLILSLVTWNLVVRCSGLIMEFNDSLVDLNSFLESIGYPTPGDIPVLNRKVFRGQRVSIREHPYVVSVRRRHAHYLTGTLLTRSVAITVAHPLANVATTELGVVMGESYSDRGSVLATVLLVIIHEHFDPYTLECDIAMLRFYEDTTYRFAVKSISLASSNMKLEGRVAFLTGWGRCDTTATELCLDRSSRYYPDERIDPMLRSISFTMSTSNYYCEGYKRHDVSILEGMLCTGPAREADAVCPCLGAPGAPLVVQSRLVGILSWGFGCGYAHDLPLIYTSIQHYGSWILHNIVTLGRLKQANMTQLLEATKAYVIAEWFINTRLKTPTVQIRQDKTLEPLDIDVELANMQGTVYDVRDFISGGIFHEEKQNIHQAFRHAANERLKWLKVMEKSNKVELRGFLPNNTFVDNKWFPNLKGDSNFSRIVN